MKIKIAFLFLVLASHTYSQSKVVPGIVIDSLSREPLISVNVYDILLEILYQTDIDGRFNISLNEGEFTDLYVNAIGYPRMVTQMPYSTDTLVITLKPYLPGGYQDHLAAQKYYEEHKTQIDSLSKIYDSYDLLIQKLISARPK